MKDPAETPLTPEETILWLESHREFMFEIWKKNPELRKEWERLNPKSNKKKSD